MAARRALPLWLALALAAGCGGGGDDGSGAAGTATPERTATATATATPEAPAAGGGPQRRAIEAVIARYARAVRAGDARTICARLLSAEVLRRVRQAGGDCERDLIADAVAAGGPAYAVAVRGVEVDGAEATARTVVTDLQGTRPQRQALVRERGGWRLSVGG